MAKPSTAYSFPGGVVQDTSTVVSLCKSASEWLDMASLHEATAEEAAEAGNFETAMAELRFAETKLAAARVRYADAKQLQLAEAKKQRA